MKLFLNSKYEKNSVLHLTGFAIAKTLIPTCADTATFQIPEKNQARLEQIIIWLVATWNLNSICTHTSKNVEDINAKQVSFDKIKRFGKCAKYNSKNFQYAKATI